MEIVNAFVFINGHNILFIENDFTEVFLFDTNWIHVLFGEVIEDKQLFISQKCESWARKIESVC